MEEWRTIEGYEGLYEVSDLGRVKSLARTVGGLNGTTREIEEKVMAQMGHYRGYLVVYLSKDNQKKKYFIHRLVAQAFLPNPTHAAVVNHRVGNKRDNRASELAWMTYQENTEHYYNGVRRMEDHEQAF